MFPQPNATGLSSLLAAVMAIAMAPTLVQVPPVAVLPVVPVRQVAVHRVVRVPQVHPQVMATVMEIRVRVLQVVHPVHLQAVVRVPRPVHRVVQVLLVVRPVLQVVLPPVRHQAAVQVHQVPQGMGTEKVMTRAQAARPPTILVPVARATRQLKRPTKLTKRITDKIKRTTVQVPAVLAHLVQAVRPVPAVRVLRGVLQARTRKAPPHGRCPHRRRSIRPILSTSHSVVTTQTAMEWMR
jgi:hypothetical protein